MAAGDITVRIDSETKAFRQGVEAGIIDPLDDAEKALEDLGRNRGPDQLERAMKDAQDATDKLGDETKRTADAIEREFKDSYRSVRKSSDDTTRDAKRNLNDIADEARSSGKEAAASFSGEFDDVQDFVQETVSGLGPGGLVGAAAIGAIAAVATQAVEAWNEKIQGIKDATAEMWQAAAEEGDAFLSTEAIRAEAHRILWDDAYKSDFETAEKYGIQRTDLAIALAEGEGEVYDRVHRQIMTAREEEARKVDENYEKYGAAGEGVIRLEGAQTKEIDRTITILEEKGAAVDANKEKAREAAAVTKTLEEQQRDQINRTADAAQKRYEGLAAKYGKGITVPIKIDDRAIRNYVPPEKTMRVNVMPTRGRLLF